MKDADEGVYNIASEPKKQYTSMHTDLCGQVKKKVSGHRASIHVHVVCHMLHQGLVVVAQTGNSSQWPWAPFSLTTSFSSVSLHTTEHVFVHR